MTLLIVPLTDTLIPSVAEVVQTQQRRQYRLDSRLCPVQDWDTVRERLSGQVGSGLAVLSDGKVRGYGCPDVWHLPQDSTLSAFLTQHNGIVRDLSLPDQEEENASSVTTCLLSRLSLSWQKEQTTGDLIRWPAWDVSSLQEPLLAQGFQLDSQCALAHRHIPLSQRSFCPPTLVIRPARLSDEVGLTDFLGGWKLEKEHRPGGHHAKRAKNLYV